MNTENPHLNHNSWHELFDALCIEQGYLDNLELAVSLCKESGNSTQASHDTAVRNLANWREGYHIPQKRNFLLLGKILKVNQSDSLEVHWRELYKRARSRDKAAPRDAAKTSLFSIRWVISGGATACLMIMLSSFFWISAQGTDSKALLMAEAVRADYMRNVNVRVGEAVIIHGLRGRACGDAPSWATTQARLPNLQTGTLSDGGVGTRYSRQCGGRVPARAILFTPTTPGVEQTSLFGDEINITVRR